MTRMRMQLVVGYNLREIEAREELRKSLPESDWRIRLKTPANTTAEATAKAMAA